MAVMDLIRRLFRKPDPVPYVPPFDWRNEPDCVPVPGVECRHELPRPCTTPSPATCARYGCDMKGGRVE